MHVPKSESLTSFRTCYSKRKERGWVREVLGLTYRSWKIVQPAEMITVAASQRYGIATICKSPNAEDAKRENNGLQSQGAGFLQLGKAWGIALCFWR